MASPNSEDQTPSGLAAPAIAYGVFAAFVIAVLNKTAGGMLATWAQSSSYHHGFFVLPIVLWMIVKKSETPSLNGARLPGFLILLGGALLWIIGQAATVALISQFASGDDPDRRYWRYLWRRRIAGMGLPACLRLFHGSVWRKHCARLADAHGKNHCRLTCRLRHASEH